MLVVWLPASWGLFGVCDISVRIHMDMRVNEQGQEKGFVLVEQTSIGPCIGFFTGICIVVPALCCSVGANIADSLFP